MRSTFPIRNTALWLKRAANGVPGSTAPPTAGSSAPKPPLAAAKASPSPMTDKLLAGANAAVSPPKAFTAKPLATGTATPIATPGANIPPVTGGSTMAAPSTGTHINGTGANASVQPSAAVPYNPFTGGGLTSPHAPVGGQSQTAINNQNAYRQNYMGAAMQSARDRNDPTNVAYTGPVSGVAKDRATANASTSSGGYVTPGGASTANANGTRTLTANPYGTGSTTMNAATGTPERAKQLQNKSLTDNGQTVKGPDAFRKTLEPMLPGQQAQSDKSFALNMAQKHPDAFNGVASAPGGTASPGMAKGYVNSAQAMPNGSVQMPTAAQGPTLSLNLPPAGSAMASQNAAAKTLAANAPPPPAGGMSRPDPQVAAVGAPPQAPPVMSPGTMAAFNQGAAGASPPAAKKSSSNPFI